MDWNFLFFVVFLTYIWTDTEAFIEYARVFKQKWTKFEQFDKFREEGLSSYSYHNFLLATENCFFVRLITCPICLIVWLTMMGWAFLNFNLFPQILFTWIGYFGLRKVIQKLS
jgi:hypothetical protein